MEMVYSLSCSLTIVLYNIEPVRAKFILEHLRNGLCSFHRLRRPVLRDLKEVCKVLLGKYQGVSVCSRITLNFSFS